MARTYTHKDAHALINALFEEITGQKSSVQAVDPSTFVSVGESILTYGTENILNAIGMMAGRIQADAKPYQSSFVKLRAANSGIFSAIKGKIKYYSKPALGDGSTNNQIYTNFADGFDNGKNPSGSPATDNGTGSQWEQHPPKVAKLWFAGSSTWQDCITRYDDQLQIAFRSEDDFLNFWNGVMTEKYNDIEQQKEAFDRMAVLNYLAGVIEMDSDMPGSAVNVTAAFNDEMGTSYTTQQLLTTYLTEFSTWLAAFVKDLTGYMENRSVNYHWSIPMTDAGGTTYHVMEHCKRSELKFMMIESLWNKIEARVKSAIFNEQYLSFGNFIPVKFWQNENKPYDIKVTPAIPDTSDPTEQTAGNQVTAFVIGSIFDPDACVTDYQLDDVSTTNKEARKHYRNTWFTFRRNAINDFSKKGVVLYMADAS